MTRFLRRVASAAFAVTFLLEAVAGARGDSIFVESFQTGGFFAPPAAPGVPSLPDNHPEFQNYFVGRTTTPAPFTLPERRSFFLFDLLGVVVPAGETIVGAELVLTNLFGGVVANFSGGTEVVGFTSTPFPAGAILDPAGSSLAPEDLFFTFGTGTPFGLVTFGGGAVPTGPVSIPLFGAALAEIGAKVGSGEAFVMTGRLLTFDPAPAAFYEFAFGLTDVIDDGHTTAVPLPKLVLTTAPTAAAVPEPGSLVLLATGLLTGACFIRRRRIH